MKFRPLHDHVVVRRLEGEERTKGGIVIPDTVEEKPEEGEVCDWAQRAQRERQTCPARRQRGPQGAVRQVVGHGGRVDGQDLLIMKEADILGVIEGTIASKKAV